MRRIISIFILLTMILCSYLKGEKIQMEEADQDTILYTQSVAVADAQQVRYLIQKKADITVFSRAFHLKQYKKLQEKLYVVLNSTEGLFMVVFNENGGYSYTRSIRFSDRECESFFSDLKIGKTTLKTVMESDPNGEYDFLYASYSDVPKKSIHFFPSGHCYSLRFDDSEENYLVEVIHFTI